MDQPFKTRIEQVIVNLFINAVQAMKKGGIVSVATWSRELGEQDRRNFGSRTATPFRAGDRVVIMEIADNGPGIPPEVISKVFDPFFTTKPIGQGTGLGLSTIYGFARQSAGDVQIRSTSGSGTEVTLLLPASQSPLLSISEPPPLAASTAVEDHDALERVMLYLEERGVLTHYTVDIDPKHFGYLLQAIVRIRQRRSLPTDIFPPIDEDPSSFCRSPQLIPDSS